MTMEVTERAATARLALAELKDLLGNRVTAAEAVREHHSHGEDKLAPALPDLVCFPQSTEEVSRIVRIAAAHGLPIVAFGAGTSLEGHVQAVNGHVAGSPGPEA